MTLQLEYKTLDETINYHEAQFEYAINMAHLSEGRMAIVATEKFMKDAALHATILTELRHHKKS